MGTFQQLCYASAGGDPYFSYVKQLTHFDETSGGSFAAAVGPTSFGTAVATGVGSTTQSAFGGASARTSGGGVIEAASHANYAIATNQCVVEGWFRVDAVSTGTGQILVDFRPTSTNGQYITIVLGTATPIIRLFVNSADRITGGTVSANTWHYWAYARDASNNGRLFLGTLGGGTAAQVGSTYADSNNYAQSHILIGNGAFGSAGMTGYTDEFRLTIGADRGYNGASIPVPAAPFPNF